MSFKIPTKKNEADIYSWLPEHELDAATVKQLRVTATLPIIYKHIAVMPDAHLGKGATVGSVIATKDAIIPAAVGVDIGCGMTAVKTNKQRKDLPDSLKEIRDSIEAVIPVGNGPKGEHATNDIIQKDKEARNHLKSGKKILDKSLHSELDGRASKQIASLGGGNHFIELCYDNEDTLWIMLHSGSRWIGNAIASHHIKIAKDLSHNKGLIDKDLAYFVENTAEIKAYMDSLQWAQEYAHINRRVMMNMVFGAVKKHFPDLAELLLISCHHNYVAVEHHYHDRVYVTRKGAIKASLGRFGIIPGSMGTESYIVVGKGNPQSYDSASHGAGRVMSRSKARKHFAEEGIQEAIERQLADIECRRDNAIADELPEAYKDINKVMSAQSDLVGVVYKLKQVLCVKG